MRSRARGAAKALVLFLAAVTPSIASSQGARTDSSHTLRGVVVAREGAFPLGYSVVSVEPGGIERFTDDSGRFAFPRLPAGKYRIRARQLGFVPADTNIAIEANVETPSMRISLARLAFQLAAVKVSARQACLVPGPPDSTAAPEMRAIFEQLRENAARYRLLAQSYPFAYQMERRESWRGADSIEHYGHPDTLTMASRQRWHYAPGKMVTQERAFVGTEYVLNVPTLPDFADPVFHANHCFTYGGMEEIDGEPMVRVDFQAAARLRDPDVDGAVWLAPERFQIRRSMIRLTKAPRGLRDISGVEVETTFHEIVPSIVVLGTVVGHTTYVKRGRSPVRARTETQRLIEYRFYEGGGIRKRDTIPDPGLHRAGIDQAGRAASTHLASLVGSSERGAQPRVEEPHPLPPREGTAGSSTPRPLGAPLTMTTGASNPLRCSIERFVGDRGIGAPGRRTAGRVRSVQRQIGSSTLNTAST